MKKMIGVVALVLTSMLSGCGTMTSVRQHPDFASGKRKINVIAILPVEAEYRHLVFTGENERDAERERSIASEIESGMVSALQWRGYKAKLDVVEKTRAGDKEFNFQLEQLRNAYGEAAKELYARGMVEQAESTKFKVGVGPLANTFAALAGADALMIASYQGFDKSSGLMAKEITTSALLGALTGIYYAPSKSGGRVELSLIDGVSGEVLWSNAAGGPVSASMGLTNAMVLLPAMPAAGEPSPASDKPASSAPVTVSAEARAALAAAPVHGAATGDSDARKEERPAEAVR